MCAAAAITALEAVQPHGYSFPAFAPGDERRLGISRIEMYREQKNVSAVCGRRWPQTRYRNPTLMLSSEEKK